MTNKPVETPDNETLEKMVENLQRRILGQSIANDTRREELEKIGETLPAALRYF